MNRHDVIESGLSVLAAAGVDGEIATVTPKNPQMFVIRTPDVLTERQVKCIREGWERVTQGTSLEGMKCLVLECGMSLEVVDKS